MVGDRYLLPHEQCVVAVRRHPIVLVGHGLAFVGLLTAVVAVRSVLHVIPLLRGLTGLAILVVIARVVWQAASWQAERFIVTDQRILLVTGVAAKRVAMLPLRKVTDMTYRRSAPGRLLGYGEFVMESAGETQALHRVRFLPHPDNLYLDISELLFGSGETVQLVDEY